MKLEKLSLQKIVCSIHLVRGHKVMLDVDLARLYGVETKYLKRQVNRNSERFPQDFLFRLRSKEMLSLRCQIGTLERFGRGQHSKYLPYAFTEHGILMLSSVLNSKRAIQVNIAIMRAFVKLHKILSANKTLTQKFLELERKVGGHDKAIRDIVAAIQKMIAQAAAENVPLKPKGPIGFQP